MTDESRPRPSGSLESLSQFFRDNPDPDTYFRQLMEATHGSEYRLDEAIAYYGIEKNKAESIKITKMLGQILASIDNLLFYVETETLSDPICSTKIKQTRRLADKLAYTMKTIFQSLSSGINNGRLAAAQHSPENPTELCYALLSAWATKGKDRFQSFAVQLRFMRTGISSIIKIFDRAHIDQIESMAMRDSPDNRGRPVDTSEWRLQQIAEEHGLSDRQLAQRLINASVWVPTTSAGHDRSAGRDRVDLETERLRKARQRKKRKTS